MIGGEFHYWRVQKSYWEAILDAAESLGIEVIGTYIPWEFHEVREGSYDFSLLEEFLAVLRRRRFKLFARPGPYIYAEWRNMGIPDHAVSRHKLDPEFRRKAARWIAAVMRVLQPHLGELITAVQADNEIDPMPHFYGEDLGFADWLRRRYGTVDDLNAAWGTAYADFTEAVPSLAPLFDDRRFRDSCQYRYDLATSYARWVVGEYRKYTGRTPIVLNSWPGVDAQNWRDLAQLCDLYGIDPYPPNECREGFRYFRERLRLLRSVTRFPYIAEFGSGIWHGMPGRDYSADHYRLTAATALASGVRGWNWYMLVGRDNWYNAPINERGVIHPELGEAFAEAVGWFRELRDAPPPETSCAVTWSWRYHQIAQIRKTDPDDPLLAVLHDMGIEYDFVDVDREFDPPPLLLVAGEIEQADRLWQYVEHGGRLVIFQRLIEGVPRPDGTSHPYPESLEVSLGFVTNKAVFHYRRVPGVPITARQLPWRVDEDQRRFMELAVGRTYTTGYVENRGAGTLLVLGCAPSAEAVLAVHRYFGIEIPVRPVTRGIHASRRGDRIVVVNPGPACTAKIEVAGHTLHVDVPRCSGVIVPCTAG